MILEELFKLNPRPAFLSEPLIVGVDEAGRGPVLGPMVYGIAFCAASAAPDLKKRAFADSKQLTEEKRDALYHDLVLATDLGFAIDALSAETLSQQMLGKCRISLNKIAEDSTFSLIQRLLNGNCVIKAVFVDTVGIAKTYEEKLSRAFPGIEFTVESKADATYPIVSAASIAAKVSRDRLLREFQVVGGKGEGGSGAGEVGSGYPGDPKTKAWLVNNVDAFFGFPNLVRFSWGTCRPILEERCVSIKFECDEEEEEDVGGGGGGGGVQQKLGVGGGAGGGKGKRPAFFSSRRLARPNQLGALGRRCKKAS